MNLYEKLSLATGASKGELAGAIKTAKFRLRLTSEGIIEGPILKSEHARIIELVLDRPNDVGGGGNGMFVTSEEYYDLIAKAEKEGYEGPMV